jgi:hypothetical protein
MSYIMDTRFRLGTINLGASIWIDRALQAGLVTYVTLNLFYEDRVREEPRFRAHPANFLVFGGMLALEEQCVVRVCEVLEAVFPNMTGDVPFRRAGELLAHRTAISHPGRSEWKKQWMQAFHDDGRHKYDLRAAILWDLQRSLNEISCTPGTPQFMPRNASIRVTNEATAVLVHMLRCAMTQGAIAHLPNPLELQRQLNEASRAYIELLEKHPTGRVDANDSGAA